MIYKSEITGKEYKTEKECLDDEVAFQANKVKEENDKQADREKIEIQNRLVKEYASAYEQICKEQNTLVEKAKETARKAKEEANKKVIDEADYLGEMIFNYQKKYGETVFEEDGKITYKERSIPTTLTELFKEIFG